MDARRFLPVRQREAFEAYEARGHVVYVTRKRDGRFFVSIDGRQTDVAGALERVKPRVTNPSSKKSIPSARARTRELEAALKTARHYISHVSSRNPPKEKGFLRYTYDTIDNVLKKRR